MPGRPLKAADLGAAALDGDLNCPRELDRAGQHLGHALAMLASIFNPALILLSGGVMHLANFILPAVRRRLRRAHPAGRPGHAR